MYDDIGWKIKGFARVLGVILLLAGVIAWIILITNKFPDRPYYNTGKYIKEDDIFGWLSLVAGIFGYISTWLIYGFGQLIESTEELCSIVGNGVYPESIIKKPPKSIIKKPSEPEDILKKHVVEKVDSSICINCGATREGNSTYCSFCGQRF